MKLLYLNEFVWQELCSFKKDICNLTVNSKTTVYSDICCRIICFEIKKIVNLKFKVRWRPAMHIENNLMKMLRLFLKISNFFKKKCLHLSL